MHLYSYLQRGEKENKYAKSVSLAESYVCYITFEKNQFQS